MKKFLYWAPRVLSIVLVAFVSLFAIDVFEEGLSFWKIVGGLLIHLIPTIVGVACIIIAWKKERIGGWLFMALAALFLFIGGFELTAVLMIALPFSIIGAMFLLHYYKYVTGVSAPTSST